MSESKEYNVSTSIESHLQLNGYSVYHCKDPIKTFNLTSIDHYLIIYSQSGSCTLLLGANQLDLLENEMCATRITTPYTIRQQKFSSTYFFYFSGSYIQKLAIRSFYNVDTIDSFWKSQDIINVHGSFIHFSNRIMKGSDLDFLIGKIIREFFGSNPFKDNIIDTLMTCMLLEISNTYKLINLNDRTDNNATRHISKILCYIENNCSDVSIDILARVFSYHPKYLPKLIKMSTGKSFSDLVKYYRIQYAKNLLAHTDYTITHIIELSGYKSRNGFYRNFKAETGHSPSTFRKDSKL